MNEPYPTRLRRARDALDAAEMLLIGAGAGLSAAAGLTYGGERFTSNFPDFIERYGLTDMYSAMFHRFPTAEERWAYVSRHIQLNRYGGPAERLYPELLALARQKDSFVLTTNGDGQFFECGFNVDRIFATQGDYSVFQCERACHDKLYDNREVVEKMVQQQSDCRIPSELVPSCPVCSGPLVPHLRIDRYFVQNADWDAANERYESFVRTTKERNLVLIEIGVGYNTPGIIKMPFERIAAAHPGATLLRLNRDYPEVSEANREKTVVFDEDLADVLKVLSAAMHG